MVFRKNDRVKSYWTEKFLKMPWKKVRFGRGARELIPVFQLGGRPKLNHTFIEPSRTFLLLLIPLTLALELQFCTKSRKIAQIRRRKKYHEKIYWKHAEKLSVILRTTQAYIFSSWKLPFEQAKKCKRELRLKHLPPSKKLTKLTCKPFMLEGEISKQVEIGI